MSSTIPSALHAGSTGSSSGGAPASVDGQGATCCCVDSAEILRGRKTVEISHNGSTYRLQATRLGKLILTK